MQRQQIVVLGKKQMTSYIRLLWRKCINKYETFTHLCLLKYEESVRQMAISSYTFFGMGEFLYSYQMGIGSANSSSAGESTAFGYNDCFTYSRL